MTMIGSTDVLSALLIGLLTSSHCLAMCGGISGALGMAAAAQRHLLLLLFNIGRIACYSVLGFFLGSLTGILDGPMGYWTFGLRLLAGLMLIAIAGYIGQWWMGLSRLEALGQRLWRHVSLLAQRLMPVSSPQQALAIGVLWGLLPCGLIYSTLVWASAQAGSPAGTAVLMAGFGVGTLPAMLGAGLLGRQGRVFLTRRSVRLWASALLFAYGLWTIAGGAMALQHAGHDASLKHAPSDTTHGAH